MTTVEELRNFLIEKEKEYIQNGHEVLYGPFSEQPIVTVGWSGEALNTTVSFYPEIGVIV